MSAIIQDRVVPSNTTQALLQITTYTCILLHVSAHGKASFRYINIDTQKKVMIIIRVTDKEEVKVKFRPKTGHKIPERE